MVIGLETGKLADIIQSSVEFVYQSGMSSDVCRIDVGVVADDVVEVVLIECALGDDSAVHIIDGGSGCQGTVVCEERSLRPTVDHRLESYRRHGRDYWRRLLKGSRVAWDLPDRCPMRRRSLGSDYES